MSPPPEPFHLLDRLETAAPARHPISPLFPQGLNRLVHGDCLAVMRALPGDSIDLVYVDPPFFSGRNYDFVFHDREEVRSFTDVWDAGLPGYLAWLEERLVEIRRLLRPHGSLCVHLDWRASHYVKVALDRLFGYATRPEEPGFKNEIIWCYSIGGKSTRTFARKHDSILWYTKGPGHVFQHRSPHARVSKKADTHMKVEHDPLGRTWQTKRDPRSGKVYRYPLDKVAEDWWTDIEQLNWEDGERLGYPTQKPEALLRRLIGSLTPEGGVVADFFCGGGTTCASAQALGRAWVGCDASEVAIAVSSGRLARRMAPDLKPPKRRARRGGSPLPRQSAADGISEEVRSALRVSLIPAVGFAVEALAGAPKAAPDAPESRGPGA